jgi:hydroxyacylglutathione hydrolase
MGMVIEQFGCREDNFGVLIHDTASGLTAAIDAPEEAPIRARLGEKGWTLGQIFTTHHHADHVEGNLPLKAAFGCRITGPSGESDKIPGIDRAVSEGDTIRFGDAEIEVIETPGHTLGHITFWIPSQKVAFVGDTLFAIGCGRVIEGTMEMMWNSLEKLLALPDDTAIYCGHEYTVANAKFALSVEPGNAALVKRDTEVKRLRAEGKATLPTTMGLEKETNPFLRVHSPEIRATLGMANAPAAEVFGELRRRKDNFR